MHALRIVKKSFGCENDGIRAITLLFLKEFSDIPASNKMVALRIF